MVEIGLRKYPEMYRTDVMKMNKKVWCQRSILICGTWDRPLWCGIGKYFRDNHKNNFGHQKYFGIKMFSRRCTYSLQSWQSRKIHQTWYFLSNSSWGGQSKIAERIFEQFYPNQMSTRTPSCRSRSDHWTELTVVYNCRWIQRLYAW